MLLLYAMTDNTTGCGPDPSGSAQGPHQITSELEVAFFPPHTL